MKCTSVNNEQIQEQPSQDAKRSAKTCTKQSKDCGHRKHSLSSSAPRRRRRRRLIEEPLFCSLPQKQNERA